jgi:hypothetical protein
MLTQLSKLGRAYSHDALATQGIIVTALRHNLPTNEGLSASAVACDATTAALARTPRVRKTRKADSKRG